jgi:hypothetical protein
MSIHAPASLPRSHPAILLLTIALHLGLLVLWKGAQMPRRTPRETVESTHWLTLIPRLPHKALPPVALPPAPATPRTLADSAHAAAAPPSLVTPAETRALSDGTGPEAPASVGSADTILERTRRDIGKIDRDLHKASPNQLNAQPDSSLSRLAAGINAAAAAVPPKWYEAPRVEPLFDQGGYGRRIYKVTTATGTYCVFYESNHAPDGVDVIKNGIRPKNSLKCPRE